MSALTSLFIAVDLTPATDVVLHRAHWLARDRGIGRVDLLHVVDARMLDGITSMGVGVSAELEGQAREAATQALSDIASRFASLGVTELRTQIRVGRPDQELAQAVDAAAPALVLAGAGNRMWRQAMLGSTARRLLRLVTRPLWLVRDDGDKPYAHALVACDLAPTSGSAAATAARLWPELHFDVVYVLENLADRVAGMAPAAHRDPAVLGSELFDRIEGDVAAFVAEHLPLSDATRHVAEGHPAATLVQWVRERKPDLLVLGRSGRREHAHGLEALALGSVAEMLVDLAECDLLVAPPLAQTTAA